MKKVTRIIPEVPRRLLPFGILLTGILSLAAAPAYPDAAIPWQDLSQEEQSVLAKHRSDWSSLSPGQQRKLRNGAHQYLQLPPDKRKAVERKHSQYEKMSPREREQLREKYRHKNKKD
jgi:hypothetical protein